MNTENKWRLAAALMALLFVAPAYAADNDTEFGIADDLTVLGTEGLSTSDPDVEIKGFTVFGATQTAPALGIPLAPGNIFVNGYLQVSSGMYVTGGSTFTSHGIFQSSVTVMEGNLKYGTGLAGKVLKSGGNGFVYWGDDASGADTISGEGRRITMIDTDNSGLVSSLFLQNVGNAGITLTDGSSLTVTGALGVAGYGVFNSTVQFLNNTGSLTNLYFNNFAGNVGKVLKMSDNGFLTWQNDNDTPMTFNTAFRLQMVNSDSTNLADTVLQQNGTTNITMLAGSSMTIRGDGADGLGVTGATRLDGSLTVLSNTQLGDDPATEKVAINMAPGDSRATGSLNVLGDTTSGDYVAKFYSGTDMAAWIRKK